MSTHFDPDQAVSADRQQPTKKRPVSGRIPREVERTIPVHPGELLRDELAVRGMTQADLAARSGLSTKHVNQVLQGSSSMSADVAVALEIILGLPAVVWATMDAHWQQHRSWGRARDRFATDMKWAQKFPIQEMVRRDLLNGSEKGPALVEALLGLFRVADPAAFQRVWVDAIAGFRRAQHLDVDSYATATWLLLGELQTTSHTLSNFSVTKLRSAVSKIQPLTRLPVAEGFLRAREILASCGVALAFVEDIPGGRNSGATWWPSPHRALIVLTPRYRKIDSFWFSLFHEIGHLLLHPRRTAFIELNLKTGDNVDGSETEADDFAAEALIPQSYNDIIINASRSDLVNIAESLGVAISIVAGRRGQLSGNWAEVQRLRDTVDVDALTAAAVGELDQERD